MNAPTRYSLQLAESVHLDRGDGPDDEINHSCDANVYVVYERSAGPPTLRALRSIRPGDEITLNYCATEHCLAEPFQCDCGSPQCYGEVRGYAYLAEDQKRALGGMISPYLSGSRSRNPDWLSNSTLHLADL